ncbi:ASCH domain-containing protein [Pseudoalteromonas rhizosphaerae]|uniref:ASCH domain-containing protein n=1 Tax=Pseudoalteromonas rhizosphaerae TaxID=2518973 RepID=UPI00385006E8
MLLQSSNPQAIERLINEFNHAYSRSITKLPVWHFCDNQIDADECAALVLKGIKQATTTSLYWFEHSKEALPKVGDLAIFTNWHGEPLGIIKTTNVAIVPYNEITAEYAALEGEGDKSLHYWRKVHWTYYQRELAETKFERSNMMPLVCEQFKLVYVA